MATTGGRADRWTCSIRRSILVSVRNWSLLAFGACLLALAPDGCLAQEMHRTKHPEPRQIANPDMVMAADVLDVSLRAANVYELARDIPHVLDGLYCHCDCAERDGHYSLLSCYETEHASHCDVCLGEVELAYDLHQEGKTLDEIRLAVDAAYGS